MENINTLKIKGLQVCRIPYVLHCLPVGTSLVPASRFDENAEGWVILPPETALKDEEAFKAWKDEMYDAAIKLGIEQGEAACDSSNIERD